MCGWAGRPDSEARVQAACHESVCRPESTRKLAIEGSSLAMDSESPDTGSDSD
jgi:hypothetical protein